MTDCLSITDAAREVPDQIAIETASRSLTFAGCVKEIAATLVETSAAADAQPAAIVATPSIETVLAVYAALAARRPIALLHHRLAADEAERQRELALRTPLPPDAAIVLFTSGSTGAARGVVLSRAALVAAAEANARHLGWRDTDRWLLALSLAHAGGLSIVIRCLAARRPIVLCDHDFDRDRTAELLERCTLASLVPTQLAALLDDPAWRPGAELRAVLLGGAAAPPALLERAAERGVPFLTTYGRPRPSASSRPRRLAALAIPTRRSSRSPASLSRRAARTPRRRSPCARRCSRRATSTARRSRRRSPPPISATSTAARSTSPGAVTT